MGLRPKPLVGRKCRDKGVVFRGAWPGELPRHALWRFAAGPALAFQRRLSSGRPSRTCAVKLSLPRLPRRRSQLPRQRRKCAVVRNRPVSTIGVYQPRQRPAAPPPVAPRSAAPPCYPRALRLSPAVLNPRCHATPSPPSPPKDAPKMRRSRRIVGKPRRPKVERTSEAKWPQGAAPRSPVLRLEVCW